MQLRDHRDGSDGCVEHGDGVLDGYQAAGVRGARWAGPDGPGEECTDGPADEQHVRERVVVQPVEGLVDREAVGGERSAACVDPRAQLLGVGEVVRDSAGGILTHAALAGAGLVGVAVLVLLAFRLWRGAARVGERARAAAVRPGAGASTGVLGAPGPALATSYTVTVLNPKAATVYLALAPAFVETGAPVLGRLLLLGGVHALLVAVWLGVCTGLLQRAQSRPALRELGPWAMRVGALVLVLVAARALLTR